MDGDSLQLGGAGKCERIRRPGGVEVQGDEPLVSGATGRGAPGTLTFISIDELRTSAAVMVPEAVQPRPFHWPAAAVRLN